MRKVQKARRIHLTDEYNPTIDFGEFVLDGYRDRVQRVPNGRVIECENNTYGLYIPFSKHVYVWVPRKPEWGEPELCIDTSSGEHHDPTYVGFTDPKRALAFSARLYYDVQHARQVLEFAQRGGFVFTQSPGASADSDAHGEPPDTP